MFDKRNHPGNLVRNHEPFKLIFFLSAKAVPLKILQYVKDEILFDLWLCEKGHQLLPVSESNREHMKQIMESPLVKESIQKEIRLKLMQYDYDHDQMNELDEVLNDLKPEMIFRDSMSRMIRFMVIRGMYEKAYEWISLCGGEGIIVLHKL